MAQEPAEPAKTWAGQSVPRLDAARFVSGLVGYSADLAVPGTVFVHIVRSRHARARILRVDAREAQRLPGVLRVVTGEDMVSLTRPTPSRFPRNRFPGPLEVRCLAYREVRYVGEPVAAVVATTREDARRAAEHITIEYDVHRPVLNAAAALEPGAEPVYPAWGTNLAVHDVIRCGDVEDAFATAEVVVEGQLEIGDSTSAPIEPRCYIAHWDARNERLTLQGTFQMPHPSRWAVAQALGLRESQVRVVAPAMGGTFGLKMVGHPEEVLVAVLARLVARPVAYVEDRAECLLARAREQRHRFALAARRDGTIVAFRDHIVADIGALGSGGGWQMALVTASLFPTVYNVANCEIECHLVTTNKPPWQSVRGYGKEIANLVLERAIDLLSDALRLDPVLVRRRNVIARQDLPRRLPSGMTIDSGDYAGAVDQLVELFGYDRWRRMRDEAAGGTRRIGIGTAFDLTPEGASFPGALPSGFETTTVRVEPSGEVQVLTSVTSPGGGNETGIAQLVADVLGLRPADIRVVAGDTDVSPFGVGNTSSRSLMFGGAAAVGAAQDLRAKLASCAAVLLGTSTADLCFSDGHVLVAAQPSRRVRFDDVALAAYTQSFTVARDVALPLQSTRSYKAENVRHTPDDAGRISSYPSFPYSVHAAAVELDLETAEVRLLDYALVHDCGNVVNPALVEGQIRGAVAMGIGIALYEQLLFDADGRLRTDRLKTYLLPRALDLPPLRIGHRTTPSPFHPLGLKGAGESGVGGALAAVTNAVADALGSAGRGLRHIPATPSRLLPLAQGRPA
jgi:carbon-monoxide dehydrogenase large subunit